MTADPYEVQKALQKEGRKECNSQSTGRRAGKCHLLGNTQDHKLLVTVDACQDWAHEHVGKEGEGLGAPHC